MHRRFCGHGSDSPTTDDLTGTNWSPEASKPQGMFHALAVRNGGGYLSGWLSSPAANEQEIREMSGRQVHAIRIHFGGLSDQSIIIWPNKATEKPCARLLDSRKKGSSAIMRSASRRLVAVSKLVTRDQFEAIVIYRDACCWL